MQNARLRVLRGHVREKRGRLRVKPTSSMMVGTPLAGQRASSPPLGEPFTSRPEGLRGSARGIHPSKRGVRGIFETPRGGQKRGAGGLREGGTPSPRGIRALFRGVGGVIGRSERLSSRPTAWTAWSPSPAKNVGTLIDRVHRELTDGDPFQEMMPRLVTKLEAAILDNLQSLHFTHES